MLTAITLQSQLQDGSCLLVSGPQTTVLAPLVSAPSTAALVSGPQTAPLVSAPQTAALVSGPQTAALVSGPQTAAVTAVNKTALATGTTTAKTGAGTIATLGFGTVAGTILGFMVIGLLAYGVNVMVRSYID